MIFHFKKKYFKFFIFIFFVEKVCATEMSLIEDFEIENFENTKKRKCTSEEKENLSPLTDQNAKLSKIMEIRVKKVPVTILSLSTPKISLISSFPDGDEGNESDLEISGILTAACTISDYEACDIGNSNAKRMLTFSPLQIDDLDQNSSEFKLSYSSRPYSSR